MKDTKRLTFSAMAVALGVLFMTLGFFVEVLDLTVSALCSILMLFICIEVRGAYPLLVWIATSVLGAVFFTGSLVWVTYLLIFGIFPIIKAYIERCKKPLWAVLKLVYFALSAPAVIVISEKVLGIPFFGEDLQLPFIEGNELIFKLAVVAALICALMVYDVFLTVMVRAYFARLRPAMKHILK